MVCKEGFDGCGLVGREGKDVGEATPRENDGLAGFFRLGDGGAGDDLGSANGSDVGAGSGE